MHEKLKVFLDEKQAEEKAKYEEEKNEILLNLGLYDKVYSPDKVQSEEYPYYEWDSVSMTNKYFKKITIDITDEEYELLKGNLTENDSKIVNKGNGIASTFKIIGLIIYLIGFIAGIALGTVETGLYYTRTEFSFAVAFIYWCVAFVSGTMFLGFGEIIQLLTDIKNK